MILLISINCNANGLDKLIEACEMSKVEVCLNLQAIKKNTEAEANIIINQYGLSQPLAITTFIVNPEIKFNIKNHDFKIKLNQQKISYSYNF